MADFIEKDDLAYGEQLTAFGGGLNMYGPVLGFTSAEVTDAQNDAQFFNYLVLAQGTVQAYGQEFTRYKNLSRYGDGNEVLPPSIPFLGAFGPLPPFMPAKIDSRFRQRAAKAKSSVNYTKAIGETLRIEAPEVIFDPATGKPTFTIFMDSGNPVLKWKKGNFQGVEIWVNRGTGYVKLDRDFQSPYVDRFAAPSAGAVWKYKMIYLLKDETVGSYSDEVTVTVYTAV